MSDMSAKWIMVVYVILGMFLLFLYPVISWELSKIESRRQKRLLQIQADKRGEQVNKSLTLVLPMGDFRLLITPNPSADGNHYKTWAVFGSNSSDLSERVSNFPKIAVFRKQFLPLSPNSQWNLDKSMVRKKWKKFLLGNKIFDKAFSIYAENEDDVHRVLTEDIQQGLLALSSKSPLLRTDFSLTLKTLKMIRDTDTYDLFIDTAISISEKLTGTIYEPKQTAEYVTTQSDIASENFFISLKEDIKEVSMSFFKNLFGKEEEGEPFIPTPTQSIPGLEPIIVQAIENLYPDVEDQKKAFAYALEYKGSKFGGRKSSTRILLAIFANSNGEIKNLTSPSLWLDGLFYRESDETFPKIMDAEAWVKSITKPQI